MLAAVVRIYSTLTNVVVITHFDNIRAAADQTARMTTRRRYTSSSSMMMTIIIDLYDACNSSAYIVDPN